MAQERLEEMDGNVNNLSLGQSHGRLQDPVEKKSWAKQLVGTIAGTKKKQVLLVLMGIFLACTTAGIWFFFFQEPSREDAISGNPPVAPETGLTVPTEVVFQDIVVLAPFERIQMKETSDMKLISLNVALETTDPRYKKQVSSMEGRIREIIQDQVRKMTWLELRNPQGKIQLKYELLRQINAIFPQVMVRNLYFTNFLMQ